jgi:hypothetical protein
MTTVNIISKPFDKVKFSIGMLWWKKTYTGKIIHLSIGEYSKDTIYTILLDVSKETVCKFSNEFEYV